MILQCQILISKYIFTITLLRFSEFVIFSVSKKLYEFQDIITEHIKILMISSLKLTNFLSKETKPENRKDMCHNNGQRCPILENESLKIKHLQFFKFDRDNIAININQNCFKFA